MGTEIEEMRSKQRRAFRREREAVETHDRSAETSPDRSVEQRSRRTGPPPAEDIVFLVPGLLGFESFSGFGYFADRVVAAVRAALETRWERSVPVIAVPIPPTASLAERQAMLVKTLSDRVHAFEHGQGQMRVHLVGHSTGGVDANLLTNDKPIGGGDWAELEPRARHLRARIRSVVSIASPHQGACIVRDPLARFFGQHDLRGAPALLGVLGGFAASVAGDFETHNFLANLIREGDKTYRFALGLFSRWKLLADLDPQRSTRDLKLMPGVLRRSFVTIAGATRLGASSDSYADSFFRDLSKRASGWDTGCAEEGDAVQASVRRLREALAASDTNEIVIGSPDALLPTKIDGGHNDGVVNSARQLIDPGEQSELAGIVVGDHFDVMGYYDRHVWSVDEQGHESSNQLLSGLLHSGSSFRDAQFFELYRRVAEVIAESSTSLVRTTQVVTARG